ncbi:MAG: hypothetical protein LBV52_01725 [Spirochaetaceae bacterium]|jgi:hypothetical protein|nr:hypothetical protein [Spirochaetaceae bacterium]
MANKKAIYAPGELDAVKSRLGPLNDKEAKRMQQILGGDVGYEKNAVPEKSSTSPVSSGGKPKRIVEIAPEGGGSSGSKKTVSSSVKVLTQTQVSYVERVKMDMCAGNTQFGIKTPMQVFISRISVFRTPPDRLSKWFVKERLNEYYDQFENLVTEVRLIFPRNNLERTTKLKKLSPFAYNVLNTFRQIKLEIIATEIGKVQAHPRQAVIKEFAIMLKEIYKPIYILERLSVDHHVSEAFNILYKMIFVDNPNTETEKILKSISSCLASWQYILGRVREYLYPVLMKLISNEYMPYEMFFHEHEAKICLLLGVTKEDQIYPPNSLVLQEEKPQVGSENDAEDDENGTGEESGENSQASEKEQPENKEDAAELIVIDHGLKILENLFPKAGWEKMYEFPDFYPYFADVVELKKNSELIAPEDPTQLALVLSQVIEELLYGFRAIDFKTSNPNDKPLSSIIDEWHAAVLESFERQYLPRIAEYTHFFEHAGTKTSAYISNLVTDLNWIRRYYFLPYYAYRSPTPPTFKKSNVVALYTIARHLRKELTAFATAINEANKAGGQAAGAEVRGIANPWEPYSFEVENPLSKRLGLLLNKNQRTNVSLIFFTLAIVTVLDNHLNNPNSVAYTNECSKLFRSSDPEGKIPILWVEKKSNTYALFKQASDARRSKVNI